MVQKESSREPSQQGYTQLQVESLVKEYEKEINELRASNNEQSSDLHAMIQTVNELKMENVEVQNCVGEKSKQVAEVNAAKETEMQTLKQAHGVQIKNEQLKYQVELEKQIVMIDGLESQINAFESTMEGPKTQYLDDIAHKTKQIGQLQNQVTGKQRDVLQMDAEVERYKIQIDALNSKVSELECQCIELKAKRDEDKTLLEEKRLRENLDYQININKQHKLVIEKLENKMTLMDSNKNEEVKFDQQAGLEKAQMARKIMKLENQLLFEQNLNKETQKEITKLDGEITNVADTCSSREHILHKKLE